MEILLLFDLPDDAVREAVRLAPGATIRRLSPKEDAAAKAILEAEIIVGWPPVEHLRQAQRLRWLQIASAGANRFLDHLPDGVVLTNASGVFGIPIAEHVLAMMLALVRGIDPIVRGRLQRQWKMSHAREELYGSTCGIIGLGDIGLETARRVKALGMTVLAVKRTVGKRPDCVDELHESSQLEKVLARCQHVVVTLPGTPHTHHMIGREQIRSMPRGSRLYNVGRGSTIDEQAMIDALRDGHLAGAGLDVFETEPLPAQSPLWDMDNVIISPHCSGATPRHGERLARIFLDNLQRYVSGNPLRNVVDPRWGY